jgi:DNA-binding MarR family transcriptional regulator
VHNGTEIAKRIEYPKATVAEHIKKLKAKGELVYLSCPEKLHSMNP